MTPSNSELMILLASLSYPDSAASTRPEAELGSPAGFCLPRREKIRIASSMATRSTAVTRMAISTRLPFFRRAT